MYRSLFVAALVLAIVPTMASGQSGGSFEITRAAIGGGGGPAGGGSFTIDGTIAGPAPDAILGGVFVIQGGFWGGSSSTATDVAPVPPTTPATFRLYPAHPNPSGGSITMAFDLPEETKVSARVYDVGGHLVRSLVEGSRPAGRHTVFWDGAGGNDRRVGAGVYFIRLQTGTSTHTTRVVLLGEQGATR